VAERVAQATARAQSFARWHDISRALSFCRGLLHGGARGLIVVFIVIGLLLVGGLVLSVPSVLGEKTARGSLGASLVTGALLSLAFFFLQDQNKKHEDKLADQQKTDQQKIAQRQALRITVGLQRNLSGADLSGDYLSFVDLGGKNLSGGDLRGTQLEGAGMVGTGLERTLLDGANLKRADLTEAKLQGAELSGADLEKTQFAKAQLQGATIGQGIHGHAAYLKGAFLINADLRGACLAGADLRGAHLSGADFSGAVLTDADLRGAELELDGIPVNLKRAWTARAQIDQENRHFVSTPPRINLGRRRRSPSTHAPADAIADRVVRISDGDTIKLKRLGWVRLIGLDAPSRKAPWGTQAREFLEHELPTNSVVRYELGPQRREPVPRDVGRWQVYIWLPDGRFLNQSILERGYGQRQAKPTEARRYIAVLAAAVQRAKAAGRGVWTTCP
jgi:uncharacterized protein YjbI with pentapeptide repeats/endonuclease YncB( thermonuclease family)